MDHDFQLARRELLKSMGLAVISTGLSRASTSLAAVADDTEDPKVWWTLAEAAQAIRDRRVTSMELTERMLQRIRAFDQGEGGLHSYLTVMDESALTAARRADEDVRNGKPLGILHGVPVGVKDLCSTKGVRTTAGCAIMADNIPSVDATVVTKLQNAGAVILGKLNLTEGAMTGYNPVFPVPLNPWNRNVWPGGSSSGSGIAAAAGLAYGTIGTDTGGSIRYPSACCGVAGLKPTWGRVSRFGVFPLAESLDHVGPLARSTKDCALLLEAISGHDPNDATSLSGGAPQIVAELEKGVQGLRLGWDERFAGEDGFPDQLAAVTAVVTKLAGLGAQIRPIKMPDLSGFGRAWITLCSAEAVVAHAHYYPGRRADYGTFFREWLDLGSKVSTGDYVRALGERRACIGVIQAMIHDNDIDVLIAPTQGGPPPPIQDQSQFVHGSIDPLMLAGSWAKYTAVHDFTGAPTLSLPCGFTESGLPLSVQFVGRHGREDEICRVGHAYEQVTDYHKRHPDLR